VRGQAVDDLEHRHLDMDGHETHELYTKLMNGTSGSMSCQLQREYQGSGSKAPTQALSPPGPWPRLNHLPGESWPVRSKEDGWHQGITRIGFAEERLRQTVKDFGARWDPAEKLW
jgi:hypothetical protein